LSDSKGEKQGGVLREVDGQARRLAGTLLRTARFAALAHAAPLNGWPSVSRVLLATAIDGSPVFLISQLSPHFRGLEGDARCSVLVGEPGKGDPLAHARMSIFGRARRIGEDEERRLVRSRFLMRHPKAELYADFGDFAFWQVDIERASLNGGFGKAYELAAADIVSAMPGLADLARNEAGAVQHMNEDHVDAIDLYAGHVLGEPVSGWRLACLDPDGLDLVKGDRVARLWFDTPMSGPDDMRPVLVEVAKRLR